MMAGKTSLPEKKAFVETLLTKGTVLLHVDPRREGVSVPPWLGKQPQLVLQIGYNLAIPIPDLTIDESGVGATLSFSRSPYACYVPWKAVFAVVGDDGKGISWPDDLPPEIIAEIEREMARARIRKESESGKPGLSVADKQPTSKEDEPHRSGGRPRKRSNRTAGSKSQPKVAQVPPETSSEPVTPSNVKPFKSERAPGTLATIRSRTARTTGKNKSRPLPPYLRVIK
jgi:stringent starvation protein B